MGEDPRLPPMPAAPTLLDFFRLRFAPSQAHLLQSANLARKNGLPEKMVLACLLHDIAVVGFIRADHGYWGAQLLEPYVDEEVSWAIRVHQALRFFPDESVGYEYPDLYRTMFGEDYQPEPYIVAEYERARKTPLVHVRAHDLRERSLLVRSRCGGRAGGIRGHHRPALPPAARRTRQRQHARLAHVAHAAPTLQHVVADLRRLSTDRRRKRSDTPSEHGLAMVSDSGGLRDGNDDRLRSRIDASAKGRLGSRLAWGFPGETEARRERMLRRFSGEEVGQCEVKGDCRPRTCADRLRHHGLTSLDGRCGHRPAFPS